MIEVNKNFNIQLHSSDIVTEYAKLVAYLDKNLKHEHKIKDEIRETAQILA